jgi:hypothetical protein
MRFDIYAWAAPRDLSVEDAVARIEAWEAEGGDPATAPFEPSSDVSGFYMEVEHDLREMAELHVVADAEPHTGRGPVWLRTDPSPPAHVAAIRLPRTTPDELRDALSIVYGTATKFDLVFLDANQGRIHRPLAEMSAYASSTFWPMGAIRAVIVAIVGLLAAIGAYVIGIPIVSGLVIIVGVFLAVLSVVTLVAEARKRDRTGATPE